MPGGPGGDPAAGGGRRDEALRDGLPREDPLRDEVRGGEAADGVVGAFGGTGGAGGTGGTGAGGTGPGDPRGAGLDAGGPAQGEPRGEGLRGDGLPPDDLGGDDLLRDGVRREDPRRDDADRGERVHALVAEGRFAEAHVLVGDAFVERNGSAGYLLRAWILAQERRPAQAREAVDWALALAGPTETADVCVLAGVVLLSLDEAHAALSVALRASGADPDGWEPSVLLSDVYRRLGRLPDAVSAARRAAALAPHEAEAQVALARSLSAGRGPLGRVPRRYRAEHGTAVERALVLGAEPAQLSAPRGGAVAGGIGLSLLWGVQLYRIESGGTFQMVAGGAGLLATFAVVAVVVRAGTRRSGTSARARLTAVRATTRTELVGDEWLWRIGAVRVAAWVPVPVLLTTGLAADRGWRGRPWPVWAAAPAAAVGLAGVLLVLAGAYWWYGRMFAPRMLRYGGLAAIQTGLAVVLAAGTVALAARGRVTAGTWAELAVLHAAWAGGGWLLTVCATARLRVLRWRSL